MVFDRKKFSGGFLLTNLENDVVSKRDVETNQQSISPWRDQTQIERYDGKMFVDADRATVKVGRLEKKIAKLKKQRDHWKEQYDHYKHVIEKSPVVMYRYEQNEHRRKLEAENKQMKMTIKELLEKEIAFAETVDMISQMRDIIVGDK
jgi:hypothetical protein